LLVIFARLLRTPRAEFDQQSSRGIRIRTDDSRKRRKFSPVLGVKHLSEEFCSSLIENSLFPARMPSGQKVLERRQSAADHDSDESNSSRIHLPNHITIQQLTGTSPE
jgi:hypothetical protein